jgi:hypothetical protein
LRELPSVRVGLVLELTPCWVSTYPADADRHGRTLAICVAVDDELPAATGIVRQWDVASLQCSRQRLPPPLAGAE